MTPEEYLENTVRRCCSSLDRSKLGNAAIGLVEELGELMLARSPEKVLEEAGDVCWYVGYFYLLLGSQPLFLREGNVSLSPASWSCFAHAARQMGSVKKHLYQGHELDVSAVEHGIMFAMQAVCVILRRRGLSLDDALEHNARKLATRYPNGFSVEASVQRADQAK